MRKFKSFLVAFIAILMVAQTANAMAKTMPQRNYINDVKSILNRDLTKNDVELVEYTIVFYYIKFGYGNGSENISVSTAANLMREDHYNYTIDKAARLCNSKAAKTAMKTGKFGERFLKALIVSAEKAWSSGKQWVEEGSSEYDQTH